MTNTLEYRRELLVGAATSTMGMYGYDFSCETMAKIVGTKLDWEIEEEDVLYDPGSPYMDTMVREAVFDCVSQYYLGRAWPTYAEHINLQEFQEKLAKAIEEKK